MSNDPTRWTLIHRAADGNAADRAEFAQRYSAVIRAYLGARWRGGPLVAELDDAAQQVFVECFKENGALERVDPERGRGFRAFLYGVTLNVARTIERKRARSKEQQATSGLDLERFESNEDSLAQIFDRAWASALLKDAVEVQLGHARVKGPDAIRRHRLLMLRHGEDLPIREIAARWKVEREVLYAEYRKAREEFRAALAEVVRELNGGGPEAVEKECDRLREHFV